MSCRTLRFVEFVEERVGHEVIAVVMTEQGPEIFFEQENFEHFTQEYANEPMEVFIVDSQTFYENTEVDDFSEIQSYSTAEYVESINVDNSYL